MLAKNPKLDDSLVTRLLQLPALPPLVELDLGGVDKLTAASLRALLHAPLAARLDRLVHHGAVALDDREVLGVSRPSLRRLELRVTEASAVAPLSLLSSVETLGVQGAGASALLAALGRQGSDALRSRGTTSTTTRSRRWRRRHSCAR